MKKWTLQYFIDTSNVKHEFYYDYSKFIYVDCKTKGIIICPEHNEFLQSPECHLKRKQGCPECKKKKITGRPIKINNDQFIELSQTKFEKRFDYSLCQYQGHECKIILICKTHGQFETYPHDHLASIYGCIQCGIDSLKSTKEIFTKKANIKHDFLYTYENFIYINTDTKGNITCITHGDFLQTPNQHLYGTGCPVCDLSKGSLKVKKWLDDNYIKYDVEKKFKGCKNKRYLSFDFYLPDHNTCIEYDGKQHYEVIPRSKDPNKNLQTFIDGALNDMIKDTYCIVNKIPLLRIPYWEFDNVEKILSDKVSIL